MSAIFGIINKKQKCVDSSLVDKMLEALKHRATDGCQIVVDKNMGMGNCRLNVYPRQIYEKQPLKIGQFTITSDARIDNRQKRPKQMSETELNSVTDNPIVISDEEAISGGNFHGQLMALPIDYATLAAAELGNISDRRSYLLLEGKYGLPKLLIESSGLNSGFMIPQYTTAALVTENKTLCFPASADSVPTSLGQEDHVSMGSISGRKFNQVLGNLENILAIELMFAAQGLEFRRPLKSSKIIEENYEIIRAKVKKLENDRLIGEDILTIAEMVKNRAFKVEI